MRAGDRLGWRARVLAWRLSWLLPLLGLTGCAHRQSIEQADAIARRCVAAIASAPTEAEARTVAADCHRRMEGIR